jgi:hypothetical protein
VIRVSLQGGLNTLGIFSDAVREMTSLNIDDRHKKR